VYRLLPPQRYEQITFPRDNGPECGNWVDYAQASHAGSALAFAQRVESMASSGRQIFVVWASGYQTFGSKCEGIIQTLQADPNYQLHSLVTLNSTRYYQPMDLYQFTPTKP
jgi:hypothetical protein